MLLPMLQTFNLFYDFNVFIGVLQDASILYAPSGFTYPHHKQVSSICTKYIIDNGRNIQ